MSRSLKTAPHGAPIGFALPATVPVAKAHYHRTHRPCQLLFTALSRLRRGHTATANHVPPAPSGFCVTPPFLSARIRHGSRPDQISIMPGSADASPPPSSQVIPQQYDCKPPATAQCGQPDLRLNPPSQHYVVATSVRPPRTNTHPAYTPQPYTSADDSASGQVCPKEMPHRATPSPYPPSCDGSASNWPQTRPRSPMQSHLAWYRRCAKAEYFRHAWKGTRIQIADRYPFQILHSYPFSHSSQISPHFRIRYSNQLPNGANAIAHAPLSSSHLACLHMFQTPPLAQPKAGSACKRRARMISSFLILLPGALARLLQRWCRPSREGRSRDANTSLTPHTLLQQTGLVA